MQKHKWTLTEDNYLRQNWEEKSIKELSTCLNRTYKSVQNRLNYLGLVKNSKTNISMEEMYLLLNPNKGNAEIARQLNVSSETIRRHRKRFCPDIKINKHYTWSKEDELYLKENFADNENEKLAEKLGRTTTAIKIRAEKLNLKKSDKFLSEHKRVRFSEKELKLLENTEISTYRLSKMLNYSDLTIQKYRKELFPDKDFSGLTKNLNKWSKEDSSFLEENYTKYSFKELAEKLDRTVSAIKNRINLIKNKNS